jgi:hypothetical protein
VKHSSGLGPEMRVKPKLKANMKEKIFQFLKTKLTGVQDSFFFPRVSYRRPFYVVKQATGCFFD